MKLVNEDSSYLFAHVRFEGKLYNVYDGQEGSPHAYDSIMISPGGEYSLPPGTSLLRTITKDTADGAVAGLEAHETPAEYRKNNANGPSDGGV
jgi:hypothetical protein